MVDNLVGEAISRRDWQINEKYSEVTFLGSIRSIIYLTNIHREVI